MYYCGQESLRRNGVAFIVIKSLKSISWVQSQKPQNDFCLFTRQTIQYQGNPSLCPNHYAEEAEVEWLYEDLQDLPELTLQKDGLFIIGDCKAKAESQETPRVPGTLGLGIHNEAGQRLTEN